MDSRDTAKRIQDIEAEIEGLPVGTVVYKKIKGKEQPYLQWREAGKTRSRYLKASERETIIAQVQKRRLLSEELKALKAELVSADLPPTTKSYRTRIVEGEELKRAIQSVRGFQKRDCYSRLRKYLNGTSFGKVCLLYGLRRTGKTTLLFQALDELPDEQFQKAVYIKARITDTMADINQDLKLLGNQGYRYVFIDEVTLISDFIDSAALLSDVFAMEGMKIVLSGTDSLGFWMTLTGELYDRAYVIHTTFIPFREYSRLLGIRDIDEYIL